MEGERGEGAEDYYTAGAKEKKEKNALVSPFPLRWLTGWLDYDFASCFVLTEEQVLEYDGLLRQAAQITRLRRPGLGDRLLLDAGPGQVDVEQEEQGAETDDGGLYMIRLLRATRNREGTLERTSNLSPSRMRVLCSRWR